MKQYFFLFVLVVAGCSENKKNLILESPIPAQISSQVPIDSIAVGIIRKTENKYANLVNYFDSGKAVISIYNNKHPHKRALFFKTSYTNSGLFNFEYYELGKSNSLYVINKNNDLIQSWWGITNKLKKYSSLDFPLGAAAGVSSSISNMIPKLLLHSNVRKSSNILQRLDNPILLGDETVNGFLCHKISEADTSKKKYFTWIDSKHFLIRKIETDYGLKDFRVTTTYYFYLYNPKKIDKEIFAFRPYREVVL